MLSLHFGVFVVGGQIGKIGNCCRMASTYLFLSAGVSGCCVEQRVCCDAELAHMCKCG